MNKLCYLRASTGMERREQKASREEASVGVERQSICLPCPIGVSHVRDRGCLSDRRERGGPCSRETTSLMMVMAPYIYSAA